MSLVVKKSYFILLTIILIPVLQACSEAVMNTGETQVFRLRDGKTINYEQMLDDLGKAQIVFVGETHDNETHHKRQLDIIKALHTRNIPVAVGFEMFVYEYQKNLDGWTEGSLPVEDFRRIYYKNWNFPWPLYDDIFIYVRENKIPAIALNLPPEITRKVAASGFASLTKEELEKLPQETGCVVSKEYMTFIRRAYSMHGHGDKKFLYFCEAQLLWDQVMARNILEYLKKHPGRTVVVLTGNGHAWKRGIPEQIRLLTEKVSLRVVLPHTPGRIDRETMSVRDADYLLSP
jgi:uncharacterized iron-regulated protein